MSMESDLNIAGYEVWLDMVQKEKESANELEEEFKTLLKDRKVCAIIMLPIILSEVCMELANQYRPILLIDLSIEEVNY